jgi:hypothetical protein
VSPLDQLRAAGQSVWLDHLRRALLTHGGLEHRIRHDAVRGVTSNPTIFRRAIAGSTNDADLWLPGRLPRSAPPRRVYGRG